MEWLTTESIIKCGHDGRVQNQPSQTWVTIGGAPVLVDNDPEGRTIKACPNYGPTMKPCAKTLKVIEGYSPWLKIGGKSVTLSTVDGLTDGTVPGTVHYTLRDARQAYVRSDK